MRLYFELNCFLVTCLYKISGNCSYLIKNKQLLLSKIMPFQSKCQKLLNDLDQIILCTLIDSTTDSSHSSTSDSDTESELEDISVCKALIL
jgi:hypothetical protein